MRLTICAQNFELTEAIARHIEGRLKLSLATASDQHTRVSVLLSDINGSRGGIDKRCRVLIWQRHLRAIVVEAVDPDLYAAVDEAANRAKQAFWRRIKRRRTLRRAYAGRGLRRLPA